MFTFTLSFHSPPLVPCAFPAFSVAAPALSVAAPAQPELYIRIFLIPSHPALTTDLIAVERFIVL